MNIFNYMIAAGDATTGPAGFQWSTLILLVAMIVLFYFILIVPQNKKKKEMERMINSLKKGDKVITIGGIHGKVASVKDNEITLKVSDNTEIAFEKSAISRVDLGTAVNKANTSKEDKKLFDKGNNKTQGKK